MAYYHLHPSDEIAFAAGPGGAYIEPTKDLIESISGFLQEGSEYSALIVRVVGALFLLAFAVSLAASRLAKMTVWIAIGSLAILTTLAFALHHGWASPTGEDLHPSLAQRGSAWAEPGFATAGEIVLLAIIPAAVLIHAKIESRALYVLTFAAIATYAYQQKIGPHTFLNLQGPVRGLVIVAGTAGLIVALLQGSRAGASIILVTSAYSIILTLGIDPRQSGEPPETIQISAAVAAVILLYWAAIAVGVSVSSRRGIILGGVILCLLISALGIPLGVGVSASAAYVYLASYNAMAAILICVDTLWSKSAIRINSFPVRIFLACDTILFFSGIWIMPQNVSAYLYSCLVLAVLSCILTRSKDSRETDILLVSASKHKSLIRAEARRRFVMKVARDHARESRRRLAEGSLELAQFDNTQDALDNAAGWDIQDEQGHALTSRPLASNAGRSSPENGRIAARYALLICIPTMLVDIYILSSYFDPPQTILMVMRWPIYGLLYGYLYPLLRGRTPLLKASSLATGVGLFEVVTALSSSGTSGQLILLVILRIGEALLLGLGLGLAWERNLVNLAGLGWGRFRDFRALKGLTTPIVAVLVAVATTIGTGLGAATVASVVPPGGASSTTAGTGTSPK